MEPEKQPLLRSGNDKGSFYKSVNLSGSVQLDAGDLKRRLKEQNQKIDLVIDDVRLRKYITLTHAIGIMVGNVIGSGIFVSSRGITEKMGSVGASLIIWAITGMYVLLQAMCYAELGTTLPLAGGDYTFAWQILGPLPSFLVVWIHVIILAPSAAGAISQTAGLYLAKAMGLECEQTLITLIAVTIVFFFFFINGVSVKMSARLNTAMSVAKTLALCSIIVAGFVHLIQGNTDNLKDPFKGSTSDPGLIALAMLDGYYAYKGWELVTTLPEEMINPKRDLPLAMFASILLIIMVYVLTNIAYFAALTPAEVIASDAVALTFADKLVGGNIGWLMSAMVALSCMGTVNSGFLTDSRYLFAAGRTKQIPPLLSMISVDSFTPVPSLVIITVMYAVYSLISDLDSLLEYAALGVQLKIAIALIALLVLKRKRPDLKRPVSVHWSVAGLCLVIIVAMVGLSLWKNPVTAGVGIGLCLLGIPVCGLTVLLRSQSLTHIIGDAVTKFCQLSFVVMEESRQE